MRSTWLTELVEEELNGQSISVYLHMKMDANWTLREIQVDLEKRTGILVALATLSSWTRRLGYSTRQAAETARAHRLIPQVALEERWKPGIRRLRSVRMVK